VVHEKALLMVEVAALQAENQHQKQKENAKKRANSNNYINDYSGWPGQYSEVCG
jgi:hypothetical protein